MIAISQAVNEIVAAKPFISEALAEGIINISALARKIQPEIEARLMKSVQNGAIVMALTRFTPQVDLQTNIRMRKIFDLMGDIIVRSNLSDLTFKNSELLFERQQKIMEIAISKKEIFYTFVQGVFESTIVVSSVLSSDIIQIMKGEKFINQCYNLSSITLKLPLENTQEPGLYYYILRNIAWEGINIIEVISTSNEFTIVVRSQDVDKAFSVLNKLKCN